MNNNWLDSSLPWIAAVGGILAAVAGFAAAVVSGVGAQATLAQVELERKPVLILSGEMQSLSDLNKRKLSPPRNVLFLSPDSSLMVDIRPTIPTYTADGFRYVHPETFSALTLTNAGRLPLLDVSLRGTATYFENGSHTNGEFSPRKIGENPFTVRVLSLAPGATYTFALTSLKYAFSYEFDRKIGLTRVDTEAPSESTLFVGDALTTGESGVFHPVILPRA